MAVLELSEASPSSILSLGLGSWGNISLMITGGLGAGEETPPAEEGSTAGVGSIPIDPLTLAEGALWDAIARTPEITSVILEGNRIRLDGPGAPDPVKMNVADSDMPELALFPAGLVLLENTSSAILFDATWTIQIATGSKRTDLAHELTYAALLMLERQRGSLVGLDFVQDVEFGTASYLVADPEKNRGLSGWVIVIDVRVRIDWSLNESLGVT